MKPIEVDNLSLIFGADLDKLMPKYEDIPDEFKQFCGNKFVNFVSRWFFNGISGQELNRLIPKEGIDKNVALRHVRAVLGSYEPKHEHKTAACAFLLSEFFNLKESE